MFEGQAVVDHGGFEGGKAIVGRGGGCIARWPQDDAAVPVAGGGVRVSGRGGFRVQGSGLKVEGLGFRGQGQGFRV